MGDFDSDENIKILRESIHDNLSGLTRVQREEFVLELIKEINTSYSLKDVLNKIDSTKLYVL